MAAPRPQFYHPAKLIDAALHGVERAIRRAEGVALVVGSPGTGKSLLLAKIAEHVRDDFDVAFLSGARICTRRALWQSILAEIGEPYRGIDEGELRMAIVERIRGLAATGSGLVVLVDEAHTLPTRLIEELRLLANVPTPLPAVHIVLAGTSKLEELLGLPRMESLAQRIAVRGYLEPLDHAETMDYLRSQTKVAGLAWDDLFGPGCDDAVFAATDGVPRLVNQLCDQALVLAAGRRVAPTDIAAAWGEIQCLPVPASMEAAGRQRAWTDAVGETASTESEAADDQMGVIEFSGLDEPPIPAAEDRPWHAAIEPKPANPWNGPEVELFFDSSADPFEEFFQDEERVVERYLVQGPEDFSGCQPVTSREGQALARMLEDFARHEPPAVAAAGRQVEVAAAEGVADRGQTAGGTAVSEVDDSDMVVIEEDIDEPAATETPAVFAVRPGDYRSLFTRLRRGRG